MSKQKNFRFKFCFTKILFIINIYISIIYTSRDLKVGHYPYFISKLQIINWRVFNLDLFSITHN